ncbi:TPA: hypothetical protein HA278_02635 [Candidatus Woesearchaeota archaeon]|nr:hypothetical protein [archaeon]HIJ10931.1 hypothetical protein [Candidatus Woesearchaeota archaeon]|tara:strand:- start:436 stop:891 length:456 start_codon:yes stop_codon:yes gene_type:complete
MFRSLTPQEVYDKLATEGSYQEAHLDKDEVKKVLTMTMEDYECGKTVRKMSHPSWRVVFNVHYDVFRELCDQLMRFKKQKVSNHQGLFAFIVLHFEDLALDWDFLEKIRTTRNKNKYEGLDISKQVWQQAELQFDLYISGLKKEIEEKLNS